MIGFQNQQGEMIDPWNPTVMGAFNIVSLWIGLQNLKLNITAQDLDEQASRILDEIHAHLTAQDEHLAEQDKHLTEQDRHLLEQDARLDKVEKMIAEVKNSKKE